MVILKVFKVIVLLCVYIKEILMNEIIYVKSKNKDLISKVEKTVRDVISQQDDIAEVAIKT